MKGGLSDIGGEVLGWGVRCGGTKSHRTELNSIARLPGIAAASPQDYFFLVSALLSRNSYLIQGQDTAGLEGTP